MVNRRACSILRCGIRHWTDLTVPLIFLLGMEAGAGWTQSLPPVPEVPTLPLGPAPTAPQLAPALPAEETDAPPPPPAPAVAAKPGEDLRQLVTLFINESLTVGDEAAAVNYNDLYTELLARSYSNDTPMLTLEYTLIQETLRQYGDPVDQFLSPSDFNALLNRPTRIFRADSIAPQVVYLAISDFTPATAQEIRQILFMQDYSRGIILDLRGATAYDPQVVADVARLFLPRSITPLVITEDRFNQLQGWDSANLPVAAGFPLAVLVDSNTRQGAVLLAAQLGLSGNTVILGQPTQGTEKQTRFFPLPSGAAVELAVGRWQTGDNRPMVNGLTPDQTVSGSDQDWINAALQALSVPPGRPQIPQRPLVLAQEERVGRFQLGHDTRNLDASLLGNVDFIRDDSRRNVFQPNSDLKIFYLQDYILFTYRNPGVVDSFFADRIYTTNAAALTAERVGIGDTYAQVTQVYGGPGENGYNEVVPFPMGTREANREDRYYVNYDALGLGFIFEVGTNQVVAVGLYKPGS